MKHDDHHQLSFGISPKNFVLSIKPEYALKIIAGKKTVELRKKFPTEDIKGGVLIIYASSPMQKVIGYAIIEDVKKLSVDTIWTKFQKKACIERDFFDKYFEGASEGYAIALSNPVALKSPIALKDLDAAQKFSAPQSYSYATPTMLDAVNR